MIISKEDREQMLFGPISETDFVKQIPSDCLYVFFLASVAARKREAAVLAHKILTERGEQSVIYLEGE